MKNISLSLRFIFGFSTAGSLFSGYLAAVKLLSGTCAFNETCPTVFAVPACWYGFALYLTLLTTVTLIIRRRIAFLSGIKALAFVSLIGIGFAGTLTATELSTFLMRGFATYTFGVPTCFLGLVLFMLIFLVATLTWNHERLRNM
jgi:hypothetical protein